MLLRNSLSRLKWFVAACVAIAYAMAAQTAFCAGATTSVRVAKYAADGVTVVSERTVDYTWMEKNLPVHGDGETHYYHQGPVFEGDIWDPDETQNLKDKGAVKGTAVKDLCDLVGGMSEGDEVSLISVDGWHTEFGYKNIYEPVETQGIIAICWFCGRDAEEGERYGTGYPGNNAYNSAMQIVFMTQKPNREGKYVFGNTDMKEALPQEEYQHFFEGQYPSTNGLSGKWISEIRIYTGGVPAGYSVAAADHAGPQPARRPWLPLAMGLCGLGLIGLYFRMRIKAG